SDKQRHTRWARTHDECIERLRWLAWRERDDREAGRSHYRDRGRPFVEAHKWHAQRRRHRRANRFPIQGIATCRAEQHGIGTERRRIAKYTAYVVCIGDRI